jgi:predicted negative regulator of RcsB-dependent stress response
MHIAPLLISAALALAPAPPTQKTQPTPSSEKGSASPAPAGSEVLWARTFDEAVASAQKLPEGRILIEFTEPRCGDCRRLESLVVPATSFYALTRDKVPVQIDRTTPEGLKLAQRLGVREVPAWVIVTPDLVLCGIQVGTTNQSGWFSTFAHSEESWAAYRKKLDTEKKEPANEDLVFDIAQETFKRGGDAHAEKRFRKLAASAAKPALREQSLAYLASIELDAGRIDDASRDLDQLLATAKDPILRERAELRRADVDIARGHKDVAARRLAQFKKEHPASPLVKEADALLAELKKRGFAAED